MNETIESDFLYYLQSHKYLHHTEVQLKYVPISAQFYHSRREVMVAMHLLGCRPIDNEIYSAGLCIQVRASKEHDKPKAKQRIANIFDFLVKEVDTIIWERRSYFEITSFEEPKYVADNGSGRPLFTCSIICLGRYLGNEEIISTRECGECGSRIENNNLFCRSCGTCFE